MTLFVAVDVVEVVGVVGQLVDQVGVHFIVDFVDELLVLFAQK
jgi:hypothetical protein